jgi:hypothetical protein
MGDRQQQSRTVTSGLEKRTRDWISGIDNRLQGTSLVTV